MKRGWGILPHSFSYKGGIVLGRLPEPVNIEEYYLHAIVTRLDALCGMISSLLEAYADKENIATTNNTVVEKVEKIKKEVPQKAQNEPNIEEVEDNQCKATTKAGNRCKGAKRDNSDYCNIHSPKE